MRECRVKEKIFLNQVWLNYGKRKHEADAGAFDGDDKGSGEEEPPNFNRIKMKL